MYHVELKVVLILISMHRHYTSKNLDEKQSLENLNRGDQNFPAKYESCIYSHMGFTLMAFKTVLSHFLNYLDR